MAGAGMSVDSGLPDFRGDTGFWNAYPFAEKLGLSFADLASPDMFETNPRLAWAFYGHRMNLYRETEPHDGYKKLLELCQGKEAGYFVFTSNVDGHFQKAGFDNQQIVECHGAINRLQCVEPCDQHTWSALLTNITVEEESFSATNGMPTCNQCGGLARPNILMFNDDKWIAEEAEQQKMRMYYWWQSVINSQAKVAVIELGAGTVIKTVRNQAETYAGYENSSLIRINPREYDVSAEQLSLPVSALSGIALLK